MFFAIACLTLTKKGKNRLYIIHQDKCVRKYHLSEDQFNYLCSSSF